MSIRFLPRWHLFLKSAAPPKAMALSTAQVGKGSAPPLPELIVVVALAQVRLSLRRLKRHFLAHSQRLANCREQ